MAFKSVDTWNLLLNKAFRGRKGVLPNPEDLKHLEISREGRNQ